MRPTPLPRTKHVNQLLVIARKDAKPKFLAWANIILIPGLAAASSCAALSFSRTVLARSAAVCVDTHPLASVQSAATAIIVVVSFIVNAPPVLEPIMNVKSESFGLPQNEGEAKRQDEWQIGISFHWKV